MTFSTGASSSKGSLVLSINSNSNSNIKSNINNYGGTMKKKYEPTVYYYTHFIESFIADTVHLGVLHKYAFLTLIWEAHRKRGVITQSQLESLLKRNKDIPIGVYLEIIDEFWDYDDDDSISNIKVTSDMQATKLHRNKSSQGGKTSSLDKMIDSDKRQDEYNQIHDAYPSKRRVARKEGLALYCKQLQDDKRMTFKRIMEVVKGFDCQPQYYPMLDTLLRDTQGKYWKAEKVESSHDRAMRMVSIGNIIAKKDSSFYTKPMEEQTKLIHNYIKENA